jgi:tetratricopeptide (TPR) repeat protein
VRHYQEALALEAGVGGAWLGLGQAHLELGHLDEARYCFGRAERIEAPGGPEATAGAAGFLGEALRRQGRAVEAREACRRGIAAAERSEAMLHDTYLAAGLLTLGRVALRQTDAPAARDAFARADAHLADRPCTYAGGPLRVQALAGLAQCGGDGAARLEAARQLFEGRRGHDFSWFWGATDESALLEMARAARGIGRAEDAAALLRRAEEAGREMA